GSKFQVVQELPVNVLSVRRTFDGLADDEKALGGGIETKTQGGLGKGLHLIHRDLGSQRRAVKLNG
ncbi:MAG: hypothetical protein ACPHCI_00500, partial [Solirubrobacterales bacterium]